LTPSTATVTLSAAPKARDGTIVGSVIAAAPAADFWMKLLLVMFLFSFILVGK